MNFADVAYESNGSDPIFTVSPPPAPVEILTRMGKAVPRPTITLPPLFTPPGTSVTVQASQPPASGAQGSAGAQQVPPHVLQQLAQAQAQVAAAQQAQGSASAPLRPLRPPQSQAQRKTVASGGSKAATAEENSDVSVCPASVAFLSHSSSSFTRQSFFLCPFSILRLFPLLPTLTLSVMNCMKAPAVMESTPQGVGAQSSVAVEIPALWSGAQTTRARLLFSAKRPQS